MAQGSYIYNIGSMPSRRPTALSNVIRNMPTGTPSSSFKNVLQDVEAYRRRHPVYIPFEAGTPTQRRREQEQEQRQWEKEYELALRKQAHAEAMDRIGLTGGGGGGGYTPSTAGERAAFAQSEMFNQARRVLDFYKQKYSTVRGSKDEALAYTVMDIMTDPDWKSTARKYSVDLKALVDDVILSEGKTPGELLQSMPMLRRYYTIYSGEQPQEEEPKLETRADVEKFVDQQMSANDNRYSLDLASLINRVAKDVGVPNTILAALVKAESGGNPNAVSRAGAIGLTQLMPSTARELGVNPHDPVQNLYGGARYLKQMYDRYGRWDLALAAYNAGPGRVDKYGGIPPFKETQNYVRKVLG